MINGLDRLEMLYRADRIPERYMLLMHVRWQVLPHMHMQRLYDTMDSPFAIVEGFLTALSVSL